MREKMRGPAGPARRRALPLRVALLAVLLGGAPLAAGAASASPSGSWA